MKKFQGTISKTISTTVYVNAKTAEEAENLLQEHDINYFDRDGTAETSISETVSVQEVK